MELQAIQQSDVDQLVQLLSLSQQQSKEQQALVFSTLSQLEKNPTSYLVFLRIALDSGVALVIRELAALTLKNMIVRNITSLPTDIVASLKNLIIGHFAGADPKIAKTLGLILGVLVEVKDSKEVDFTILEFLLESVKNGNEIALEVLGRVIQDLRGGGENNGIWDNVKFSKYLQHLIQVLLQLCGTPFRADAMHCLNLMISQQPVSLLPHLNTYKHILLSSLNTEPRSCLRAMQGITEIAEQRKDLITADMIKAVAATNFTEDKLRKAEFTFWLEVIDSDENETIKEYIKQLLPKFIAALEWTAEDEASHIQTDNYNLERVEGEDDDNDLDDGDDSGKGGAYTMRKRAGNIVSKLAMHFSDGLWASSEPLLAQLFSLNTWEKYEIGVLYVGLIYDECKEDIKSHLLELIKHVSSYMIAFPAASQLRATSLWTFSKFSEEFVKAAQNQPKLLEDYLSTLLANLDPTLSPNVKQSACSAISKLIQVGPEVMTPAYDLVTNRLTALVAVQKGQTLFSVYDTIARLTESMPDKIKSPELTQTILVALCKKWATMKQTDMNICPIIECITEVTSSLKTFLAPYSLELFLKSLQSFNPSLKQPVLRLSDLICNLLENPTPELIAAVKASPLLSRVEHFISGKDRELKQFSYSLLNHIVKYVGLDDPQQTLKIVSTSVQTDSEALSNNALFCLVAIMKKYGVGRQVAENMYKLAFGMLKKLDVLMFLFQMSKKIYQINFSKIIGILVMMYPKELAPDLKNYGRLCFSGIKSEFKDDHMVDAYKGLLSAVLMNPAAIFENMQDVVASYLYFKGPTSQTDGLFRQVMVLYCQTVGSEGLENLKNKLLPGAVIKLNTYLV